MLTLALATIVVLTVASLALLLWPEAPPPASEEEGQQEAEDELTAGVGDPGVDGGGERDRAMRRAVMVPFMGTWSPSWGVNRPPLPSLVIPYLSPAA